ncbi:hypothetical protein HELRODRAFT_179099 [Helobdella robusta]|uniref:Uncharacterized protein n=1 Tax=Helobdella robusta TaxID=6412 RepID=T1FE58_HELRO|nr:hypothetical protein HELRODRAFT_179099 [Helobdella robusta]ESN95632.1 hypothetical protein HELRODRAFT_179099 [Helobdella robusta]
MQKLKNFYPDSESDFFEGWREYCEELYSDKTTAKINEKLVDYPIYNEPPSLKSEIGSGVAWRKAADSDDVSAELFKAGDDIILLTTKKELQNLVNRVETAHTKYSLIINDDKTKVIHINGIKLKIRTNGVWLKSVLGITDKAKCTKDIRGRIGKAQGVCMLHTLV